jgi:integrase
MRVSSGRRAAGAGESGRGRTWVYEEYGVKQAQERLGHSDPATTLRHYVRLTTAARAKAVAGLDDVTRAALERAEEKVLEDAQPPRDNVVALAGRRGRTR